MRIDEERPEHELDASRISEYLAVVRTITAITGGAPGGGVLACPVCKTGALAYAIKPSPRPGRRMVRAVCNRPGCIRFSTEPTTREELPQ